MNILGTVISINLNAQIKGKTSTYPGCKFSYTDQNDDVKQENIHENGLKYNDALKNGLEQLNPGDQFTMEKQKENDFWNVKNIYKGWEQSKAEPSSQAAQKPAAKSTPAPSGGTNTFEVNNQLKERQMALDEVKQPMIIRQTCLTATANLAVILKLKSEADVVAQANRFVEFITTGEVGASALKKTAAKKTPPKPTPTDEDDGEEQEVDDDEAVD